ncbi:MAG: chalcone isomerase family protein [Gammaproteobacteria bacterium]|nr:chalcone isomerase family protein [Gammaproteobacteria bacterium]
MKLLTAVTAVGLVLSTTIAFGKEIAGVQVPDTVTVQTNDLVLNGAGIRTRVFFKIYVGALYLKAREGNTLSVLAAPAPKSVRLHLLHSEISADKLVDAWNDGFAANHTADELKALKARIDQFNKLFPTVFRGDVIRLDLLLDGSTEVFINDKKRGAVPGEDFQKALLKIWLGNNPVDKDLKQALLGKG